MEKIALSISAHPDDTEFTCAGTLALLREQGWRIHIATMTAGDCGTATLSRTEISDIRRREAAQSAALLDGLYHCLECDDIFIMYDRPTLLRVIELVRHVRPDIVFAPSPEDYMVDHTTTGKLAMTACFACGMPNIPIEGENCFEPVPHLYYVDTLEGKDIFGNPVDPRIIVDISPVFQIKEQMLACHASQRNWLMQHHGIDEYMDAMRQWSRMRGQIAGCQYGEGFRQHLGHGFAQDDILSDILGARVYTNQAGEHYGT